MSYVLLYSYRIWKCRVIFLYGPPTNCYVAYIVIRRKIVFICSASYAIYTVITRKIGFTYRLLVILPANPSIGKILWEDLYGILSIGLLVVFQACSARHPLKSQVMTWFGKIIVVVSSLAAEAAAWRRTCASIGCVWWWDPFRWRLM